MGSLVMGCLGMGCLVMGCLVMGCLVMGCLVMGRLVMGCFVCESLYFIISIFLQDLVLNPEVQKLVCTFGIIFRRIIAFNYFKSPKLELLSSLNERFVFVGA